MIDLKGIIFFKLEIMERIQEESIDDSLEKNKTGEEKGIEEEKGKFRKLIEDCIFGITLLTGYTVREIEGKENIPNGRALILPWHLNDQNVLDAASILYSKLGVNNVSIVSQATNYDLFNGLLGKLLNLSGKDRFFPISNTLSENLVQGSNSKYYLNSKDFRNFIRSLEEERKLVIAGHRPTQDGNLPKRAGIGGIISAYLTGSPIIPVTFSGPRLNQTIKFFPELKLEEITIEEKKQLEDWVYGDNKSGFSFPRNLLKKILKDADKILELYKKELEKIKKE